MNRTLRRWHLRLVTLLAPGVVVVLATGVAARRTAPENTIPPWLAERGLAEARVTGRRLVRDAGLRLELGLILEPVTGARGVELRPLADPHLPDLLVYWSAAPAGGTVPADATLLGPLGGRFSVHYRLPGGSANPPGGLVIYSPATARVIANLDLAPLEPPTP